MELNKAKELLRLKKNEEEERKDAEATINAEEERKVQKKLEQEKQEDMRKINEFMAKIPNHFCVPHAKCGKCGNRVPITNEAGIKFVDQDFRVNICNNCGTFVIDNINLNDSIAMTELEPYVLNLVQETR
jgi:hypothetical protein